MRIKFEWADVERCFGISWVVSKATLDLFLFFYYFDIEIHYKPKDWMLYKGTMKLDDGRKFGYYEKNERYKNLKFYTFVSSMWNNSK